MTTDGWIFMILSWGGILTLIIFAYSKTFAARKNEKNAKR
jgi:hypothetical protein